MKIEKQFNRRSAPLINVGDPFITTDEWLALGVKVRFFACGVTDSLAMHMTREEAIQFANRLLAAASE